MSRELDSDQENWSEEDWAYAKQRPEVYGLSNEDVAEVRLESALEAGSSDFDDDYDEWKLNELKEEAVRRDISVHGDAGRKSTFVDALREWDRQNPEGVVSQG